MGGETVLIDTESNIQQLVVTPQLVHDDKRIVTVLFHLENARIIHVIVVSFLVDVVVLVAGHIG
jgi:hypothetical protein